MKRGVPRRRRPGPVVTAGVEALLPRGEALAKGWLVALVEDAPLEAAAAIMAGDIARDGPRICDAVVRAIYDETDLLRIEASGIGIVAVDLGEDDGGPATPGPGLAG